jgi:hypothetical protein
MPISEMETRRLFEKLANQLREAGASTLVDQVIDEIAQGKQIVYKTVARRRPTKQLQRAEGDEIYVERGRGREYAETLDYSAPERLELLLEALERAVLDAQQVESDLLKHYPRVRFVPEQQEENVRSFELSGLTKLEREAERLRTLIADLRLQTRG